MPAKSASSMSSLTTKGRVVKTKTISTGSLTYVYLHDHGCWVVPAGASIPRPTRSTRAKETHGDVSVRLQAHKGREGPVKNGKSGLLVCAWGFIPFNVQCLSRVPVLTPQDRRRPAESSHLDSQIVVKRVQSRIVSSQVSLCVHEGLFLSMYSACQEC